MHPVYLLAFVTLLIVLGFGVWQWRSVRSSQRKRHETKAEGHPFGPTS
jgi:membrane-anchored protein YejM (alkaline phosphatase superfamily)